MSDDDIEVLTGNVNVTIYGSNDKPVKNAQVSLIKNNTIISSGLTDRLGECLIENITYDTYTVLVTRTGYEPYTTTITVDSETITLTITLNPTPTNPLEVEVDLDQVYTFTITEQVDREYGFAHDIITWLQTNMMSLVDDYGEPIFGKVNLGFSEESLRTFGKKPVCDVYINGVEYTGTFDNHFPSQVNTIILFYFKGANSPIYLKASELHDLVMQRFINDEGFQRLDNVVKDTYITNSELRIQPIQKKWGVMGAFELTHHLY